MSQKDWLNTIALLKQAFEDKLEFDLFKLLLTTDEREAIINRVKIVALLLDGSMNQRELKDHLGIGIATVTRGSNSLKEARPEFKTWLEKKLNSNNH
ncbi:MAG: trp operon repressor [Candidatus Schmidhempelia sp.]|nr:trp operon repressor [Candidatus Schmidhempelia sp.]